MSTATAARGTMSLTGHLDEARRRGVRAAVAILIGAIVGFALSAQVLDVLRSPIEQISGSRAASLNYDTVTGAFDLRLRMALFTGLVLSSPVWLYQLFAFVVPALNRREKQVTLGFLAAAVPLFLTGCAFGLSLFPHMVELLTGFSSAEDSTILNASYYVDFVMKLVLAVGVAFVLPVFVVVLNAIGVLPATTIRRGWRVVVIVIALFSGLVTPAADVLSMFLLALPMTILFAAAGLVAHVHDRRLERRLTRSLSSPKE